MSANDDEGAVPAQAGGATNDESVEGRDGAVPTADDDGPYEEECVICLEPLSLNEWGRCTPCGHAFHSRCWWDWENAHNERVDRDRVGGRPSGSRDEGPKCCLCNAVNQQFVDGAGKPSHNPSPYVASEDPMEGAGGNLFSRFVREASEGASDFMDFLNNEYRDQRGGEPGFPFPRRGRSGRGGNDRAGGEGGNYGGARSGTRPGRRRRSPIDPPFFDPRGDATDRILHGVRSFFENPDSQWRQPARSSSNPYNLLTPGTKVVMQNLVGSPHLNGRRGSIVRYQPDSRRYLVRPELDVASFIAGQYSAPVALRPGNLLQVARVKVWGLRSQPRLNGREGTVEAYSRERGRYAVRVDAGLLSPAREVSLRPVNIHISDGTVVRLEGLQRAPHWNGKYGTIVRWVEHRSGEEPGRYEVQLSRQYAVLVRADNVWL